MKHNIEHLTIEELSDETIIKWLKENSVEHTLIYERAVPKPGAIQEIDIPDEQDSIMFRLKFDV